MIVASKKAKYFSILLGLILFIGISAIILLTTKPVSSQDIPPVIANNPRLASVVNGQSVNTPEIFEYFSGYHNFSNIEYETIPVGSEKDIKLTVGNREDNIKGIEIANKRFVIHLVACDYNYQMCGFKVNGVNTGELHSKQISAQSEFNLDDNYKIVVNSIIWDYCDNRRFCNLHYEAYDVVNVTILPRG